MSISNNPNVTPTTPDVKAEDIDAVYEELVRGVGHELVNDNNVSALISRAQRDGHPVLAEELREWKASCG